MINFSDYFRYVCKSIDVKGSGIFKPADWKFQKKATKWFELQTVIDLDRLFLIPMNDDEPRSLRNQLEVKYYLQIVDSKLNFTKILQFKITYL